MKRTALFLFVFLITYSLFAQKNGNTVRGRVYALENNEVLINANVYTSDLKSSTQTNEFGEYYIVIDSTTEFLIASYVGFKSDTIKINDQYNFYLKNFEIDYDITIVDNEIKNKQDNIGLISMPLSLSKQIPQLFGTTDVLKSLALYPGISLGVEGFSGLFVRGGGPGQNLTLLDGNKIYNSSHLFGFNSVFNPLIVKSVDIYKGGFPIQYGDRLSSIVRINTKDGNPDKHETNISIGMLESGIVHSGPISKLNATYSLAARYSYLSLITLPNRLYYNLDRSQRFFDYYFYDTNAKFNSQITKNQSLRFSFFKGHDFLNIKDKLDPENESSVGINWGNMAFNLRYSNAVNKASSFDIYLNYSKYLYNLNNLNFNDENSTSFENNSRNSEPSIGLNWTSYFKNNLKFLIGGSVNRQRFLPYETTFRNSTPQDTFEYSNTDLYSFTQFHAYAGIDINLLKYFSISNSLRISNFGFLDNSKLFYSPRFKISFKTTNFKSTLTYDRMNQFEHLLLGNGGGLPNEIWVPSIMPLEPQSSVQYALGFYYQIPSKNLSFNFDLFHRTLNNQTLYFLTTNSILNPNLNWLDLLELDGEGKISGIELFIRMERSRIQYSFSYTYLYNKRKFIGFNQNKWFESSFSRKNDLQLNFNYRISKKWTANLNFVYSTGYFTTLPSSSFYGISGEITPVYEFWNNIKVRDYNRADIGFTYKNKNKEWKFGIYNFYAYQNPMFYQHFSYSLVDSNIFPPSIYGGISQIWGNSPLIFIPYVSYQYNF